jgi:DNA-directed RNA polymerase specialized sigma24 family protein
MIKTKRFLVFLFPQPNEKLMEGLRAKLRELKQDYRFVLIDKDLEKLTTSELSQILEQLRSDVGE